MLLRQQRWALARADFDKVIEARPSVATVYLARGSALYQLKQYRLAIRDLDEALKWAAIIPAARDASVEVRPIVATQAPV